MAPSLSLLTAPLLGGLCVPCTRPADYRPRSSNSPDRLRVSSSWCVIYITQGVGSAFEGTVTGRHTTTCACLPPHRAALSSDGLSLPSLALVWGGLPSWGPFPVPSSPVSGFTRGTLCSFLNLSCLRKIQTLRNSFQALGSFPLQLYRKTMGWPGFKHSFKEKNSIGNS